MSDHQNYSTTKDLGKAFAILVFLIVGVPVLWTMSLPDYHDYCVQSVLPCIGGDN